MKGAIRRYCNEGHNILTAFDVHEALKARQVKGSSAAVCELDRGMKELKVNRINNFSAFHNENEGLRLSKVYGVGSGRLIPWSELVIEKQGNLLLKEVDNYGFFAIDPRVIKPTGDDSKGSDEDTPFQCQEPGCYCEFSTSEEFQDHVHFERHKTAASESVYDGLRHDWASRFSSLTLETKVSSTTEEASIEVRAFSCTMGWALQKPRGGGTRFPESVKAYLSKIFETGEKTGRKADPGQVAADMRKVRDIDGARKFKRSELLTKTQVQGFFSRLAALKRGKDASSQVLDEDEGIIIEENENYLDVEARNEIVENFVSQMGLVHPVTYDGHDICEHVRLDTLCKFNVTFLKAMCAYFELPYKAKDFKFTLLKKIKDIVRECTCYK